MKPRAPASRSSAISVSPSPLWPGVTQARNPVGTRASAPRALPQRLEHRRGVHHRIGVRHRDDRGEPARRGRPSPGVDVLLVLAARGPEVHVRIDERRERVQPVRVHDLGALGRLEPPAGRDLGDLAVADQQVAGGVEARARVEERGSPNERVGRRDGALLQRRPAAGLPLRRQAGHAGCGSVAVGVRSSRSRGAPAASGPPASSS